MRLENFAREYRSNDALDPAALKAYLRGPRTGKRFGGLVSTWEDYLSLFEGATDEVAIGEASVCYLWSPTAARNIAARIPDARIVAVLRHPAERAWSQYLHGVANGYVRKSFREQIEACMKSRNPEFSPIHPFLEFGMYYEQIKAYFELFPRESIRIYFYEDGLAAIVADLFCFLNVDPFEADVSQKHLDSSNTERATPLYATLRKHHLLRVFRKLVPGWIRPMVHRLAFRKLTVSAMPEEDRRFLCGYYRDDVMRLAVLLDRDLHSWLV
jgi:hypothetical protein